MKPYRKTVFSSLLLSLLFFAPISCKSEKSRQNKTEATPSPTEKVSYWKVPNNKAKNTEKEKTIRYGEQLITHTARFLSPSAPDSELRSAGNHLACTNCHLQSGKAPSAMGFIGIHRNFPKMYAPLNRKVTLSERIQACFKGSLNGTKPIPLKEENAMLAYLEWLGSEVPTSAPVPLPEAGLPPLNTKEKGDPVSGQTLYVYHCAACHGKDGLGMRAHENDLTKGYTFPPLWGNDSYSKGSSMANIETAARYIHQNMPLGRAVLTASQALDIAVYMNTQERPAKKELES